MDRSPRHRTAVEFAVDEIKRRIVEQELRPGARIDQNIIAETLGLSRIPVRQALANLAARGFVVVQAHRSAVVAPLSGAELRDVYALRCRMEPWAMDEACRRFGEKEFVALDGLMDLMERAAQNHDLARYMELNREFHFALFAGTENPHLLRILQGLFDTSERYQWVYVNAVGSMKVSIQDHREILARMRAGDHDGAIALSVHHSQKTAEWLRGNVVSSEIEGKREDLTRQAAG
ncbi:MAG: GntR family transcriptional regulator [Rhodospirillales bacterium]|nr:GntR family transcriptional regulator [Rhodospirillales bacterium]